MKIDRLLSITLMLINRSMVTARELSEKYDVTIRTIYRDIEAIIAAGIPVVAYQGKQGGFCLMDNYRIDRQLLTLSDMTSILLALKGLNTALNNESVSEAIEKIESIVPDDKRSIVNQQFDNVIIDLSYWGEPKVQKDRIALINRAVTEKRLLMFRYRNLRGEELVRTIEPMSLILKMNYWYVYGYCRDRDDYRLFRVSRMLDCTLLDTVFVKKDKLFDEKEFFNNQTNVLKIRLKFSSVAKSKVEEFFANHNSETLSDGSIIVTVDFPEDEWVYSTLLSYGETVEVLSPPHLRQLVKEKLKKAYNLYKT